MAMNNELAAIVSYIERERGVEREDVLTAIEMAIEQGEDTALAWLKDKTSASGV